MPERVVLKKLGFVLLLIGFFYPSKTMAQGTYIIFKNVELENSYLTIHWHQMNTDVWLNFTTFSKGKTQEDSFFYKGELDQQGHLSFRLEEGENSPIHSATLEADNLTIDWHENDLPSHFKAAATDSYVKMQLKAASEMERLIIDQSESPTALMELRLLVPLEDDMKLLAAFKAFYGCQDGLREMDDCIRAQFLSFFNQYREMVNIPGDKGPSFQWLSSNQTDVIYNTSSILGLRSSKYVFTGGAHGMQHMMFGFFDIQQKRQLDLSDLFDEQSFSALSDMLTVRLKLLSGLSESDRLSDNGYFVDLIEPTNNFYITPGGIGFYYNSYQIAPYAMGHTRIWLSFDDLSRLLKPGFLERVQISNTTEIH